MAGSLVSGVQLQLLWCVHAYIWRVIFVESLKRPSKLIFVVLNFMTATSTGAWHCCTSDDVIDTGAPYLLCY